MFFTSVISILFYVVLSVYDSVFVETYFDVFSSVNVFTSFVVLSVYVVVILEIFVFGSTTVDTTSSICFTLFYESVFTIVLFVSVALTTTSVTLTASFVLGSVYSFSVCCFPSFVVVGGFATSLVTRSLPVS